MIEVHIPGLRIQSAPNLREHHFARARRVKGEKRVVTETLHYQRPRLVPPELPLTVHMTRIAPRSADDDNLTAGFKATRDAIADWLHVDDGDSRVTWTVGQETSEPRRYGVRITITAR